MAETPQSIQESMRAIIAGLQSQLDALNADIFTFLPNGRRKYSPAERAELNNVRSKLVQEIFHREVMAAFDAATFTVVHQPTVTEVDEFRATLVELGKPLPIVSTAFAVVNLIEGLMSKAVNQLNELTAALAPKP